MRQAGGGEPVAAGRRIAVVVGTRPEIIKLAPVVRLLGEQAVLLHSGQHTDDDLSGVFLSAAGLPVPEPLTGIRGATRPAQIGRMTEQFGARFAASQPAAVVVQGDTNTASAAAQAASYCGVPVVHVEAGLRSFDRDMPEEINRCLIGVLADLHCAPTRLAVRNLRAEQVPAERIELTGNTIVEALLAMRPSPEQAREIVAGFGLEPDGYVLATIHRPENTDVADRLAAILDQLAKLGLPVLFPVHPRTGLAVRRHQLSASLDRLKAVPPLDHRAFLALAAQARLIVSDSGGVQEECTVLKRPMIVVRNSTERPESIRAGFAQLVRPGQGIGAAARAVFDDRGLGKRLASTPCPFGDGTASLRITALLRRFLA
jgi:UDP-N-acetylglucosamine 2-epimerase (non-hydrolysing)